MRLSTLTYLGFEVNALWDACPDVELSLSEVHEAAKAERLVALLEERFSDSIDVGLITMQPAELAGLEKALSDAASALEGREKRKVGVRDSGLCLVMALVLEAIQQQFCPATR